MLVMFDVTDLTKNNGQGATAPEQSPDVSKGES